MKQIAVKQLDLMRHVASGFSDQTDLLQQISDVILEPISISWPRAL